MKHTIKLLTLAFTLAAILTLTGCPGPVNTVVPCTHENKKTVIETAATCTETGLEKIICADCGELIEEKEIAIDPDNHDFGEWEITEKPTCTEKGSKTGECSRCGGTETVKIDALGHDWVLNENTYTDKCNRCGDTHTFIAGGCDECGEFKYSGTQVKVYVYTFNEEKQLNDLGILYYSFEETNKTMNYNDLLSLKPAYKDYTVSYCETSFINPSTMKDNLKNGNPYITDEESDLGYESPIGIIIEPQTN